MKRGYKFGVEWIALNDEPTATDPKTISGFISTSLLADLFGKKPETVARDILKYKGNKARREGFAFLGIEVDDVIVDFSKEEENE